MRVVERGGGGAYREVVVDPGRLVGLLADPTRLRVLAAIVLGATDDAAVTAAAGLGAKDVVMARQKLADAGLLDGWTVDYEALRAAAREQSARAQEPADEATPRQLGAFVRHGRLLGMPVQHARRQQLLAHIAAATFEADQLYTEAEVNERLVAWCGDGPVDHVTVRRYLIDAGLLVRGDGTYQLPSLDSNPEPALGEVYVRSMGFG